MKTSLSFCPLHGGGLLVGPPGLASQWHLRPIARFLEQPVTGSVLPAVLHARRVRAPGPGLHHGRDGLGFRRRVVRRRRPLSRPSGQ